MSGSPPPSTPGPTRPRKRRWLRRLLWGLGLTVLLLWIVKVPLLNWALRQVPGDYDISVSGVHPGLSGATLSGVRVVHRPTGRQLGHAQKVEVAGNWARMVKGEMRKLIVSNVEAVWRPEFETVKEIPLVPGPPASGIVTWQHGEVRGGVFSWYERGKEIPRLSLRINRYDGGPMTIYGDGTIEASAQAVVLDDVVSREFVVDDTLEIESRSPRAEGVITAQHKENRYTVESLKLSAPQLNMVWRRGQTPRPAEPEPPEPSLPAWYRPAQFVIRDGLADPARVMFTVHSAHAAPVEFSASLTRLHVAGLRAAGGLPFIIPEADGRFEGMKSPGATMEANELIFAGKWDEQSRIHLTSAEVNGAAITDSNRLLATLGLSPEETKSLPVCRTGLDAKCVNLVLSSEGITSADPQQIVLKDFSALLPGDKEPVGQTERVEISAVPDEALKDKRVRSVTVHKPEVKISESKMIAEMHPFSTPRTPGSPRANNPDEKPEWYGWRADALTVHEGQFSATDLGTGIPNASGTFSVLTAPRDPGGEVFYRIRVDNLSFENPILPAIPLKTGGVMDLDVHPVRLWSNEEIDEVRVNGHKVEMNEAFMKLFETGDETKPPPSAPAEPPPPPDKPTTSRWKVRRVVIANSEFAIDNIGDGRRLVIPVREQIFENVPLSAGMLEHDSARAIQKVEVPAIYLYAPFHEGHTVAELPVNFIYFSFAGLMEKRLERVELVNPKIKAGKPLFDFIEVTEARFSKSLARQNGERVRVASGGLRSAPAPASPLPVPPDGPALNEREESGAMIVPLMRSLLAALSHQVAAEKPNPLAEVVQNTSEGKPPVWDIPFFTETGMIITAPNGVEWTEIPRLPFRNAKVREGPDKGKSVPFRLHGDEVTGELAIEPGWYDFPEYQVRIRMSDEGRVVFNFPLKEKNNNLVEVFRNNTAIYRHLLIEKIWLSVTYDQQGIYVGFGGETCGGYITGNINLYLDPLYSWDASASFTGVDMKPVTGKLTREYVLMDGKVDILNMTAYGDMTGLHQTTANLKMSRPGKLRIKALDELRRRFVDTRVDWADDFGRVTVDSLRSFDFTSCDGSAKLFGQEGTLRLKFGSRAGSRDFTINLHDYRHRPEKSVIRF